MPFASALSLAAETSVAAAEVGRLAQMRLGAIPDLALVFFSPHHLERATELATLLQNQLTPKAPLLGCVGEFIVSDDREIEGDPPSASGSRTGAML
jgi:small ligand-binding sensory domain FIST